ncbi:MAG: Hsp20/alpha crystallin family protein [Deltaproteobacteria bacterium]
MELGPWSRFGDLSAYRKEFEKFFTRLLTETPSPGPFAAQWMPLIEISETTDKVFVRAELPGLEAKDVSVSMSGDLLTIKGKKERAEDEKDEHCHYVERYYGPFQRSVKLPINVTGDEVEGTFNKGVLKITLRKVAGAEKREIRVKDT